MPIVSRLVVSFAAVAWIISWVILIYKRDKNGCTEMGDVKYKSETDARHRNAIILSSVKQKTGGSVWESNPPKTLLMPPNGFEVREAHRDLNTPLFVNCWLRCGLSSCVQLAWIIGYQIRTGK